MKVIIAGSRSIQDYELVSSIISNTLATYSIPITQIVSGCADGVDVLGEQWALENDVPVEPFPAKWNDLDVPGAKIKTNRFGNKYNALAGFQRNEEMAKYGDVLILIWDGKSYGSSDMKKRAIKRGLAVYEYVLKE